MFFRIFLFTFLGVGIGCIFNGCSNPTVIDGPSVHIEVAEFNIGAVTTDVLLEHYFKIENRGNKPLTLQDVKTSCGCAAAIIQKEKINPNETGHVHVSFHPVGSPGIKTATAVVTTNDPKNAKVMLRMRCDFRPELYAAPEKLMLDRFPANTEGVIEGKFKIISGNELEVFEILEIDTTAAPELSASYEMVRLGIEYEISVTNIKPIAAGRYSGTIVIKTNNRKLPEISVPVMGNALGPVEVQPTTVLLDKASEDKKVQDYIIRVIPGTVEDFNVVKVSVPVGVSFQTETKGKYTIVRLIDMPGDCALNGSYVTIETDVADMEPLQVPIVVRGCSAN